MTNKFHLSSIAVLIGGIALTGCANKQTYSPELEEARQTYAQVSADPLVSSLASAELKQAEEQLQVAEDASDYFKGRAVIAHEAQLAKLELLNAQETARALATKESLRVAQNGGQGGAPADPNGTYPGSHTPIYDQTPVLAAATPTDSLDNQVISYADTTTHGGSIQGGHHARESSMSDTRRIALKLASLTAQIQELQASISSDLTSSTQTSVQMPRSQSQPIQAHNPNAQINYPEQASTVQQPMIAAHSGQAPIVIDLSQEPSLQHNEPVLYSNEPALGAARAAPGENNFAANELPAQAVSAALPPVAVKSNARLRAELRAMNARPSERGMSLTLGERYFQDSSARLWKGRSARHLDNIAALMVENKNLSIDVEAHFDNSGADVMRQNLTEDRAIAIKAALVLRGVNAARINTAGLGDSAPIAKNNTQIGRLQNRRVEIIFPNVEM